ncbi:MAG: ABC transporter permease [Bosea sp.]|jgi:peptide/nickel transport system permease protein|nr:ABC transporter permease [Bosea sp. (in: a-proteobacteria)]
MIGYILRRLLMTIPTLLLVSLAVFTLVRLIPGDPVSLMFGDGGTPEQIARGRAALGLDQPVFVQFWRWLTKVAVGDFGNTITDGQAVLPLILQRFQVSASVVLVSVAMAALVGVTIGIMAAWKQDSKLDVGIIGLTTVILSIPTFWLGLLLLLLFGLKLGWLPVIGYVPISEDPWKAMLFLLLPVATLTLHESGVVTRMARASAIEVLRLEYITHARAKGLSEARVLARHVLPNAFAPTWTLIGLILGNLLGGIAVLETVFTLPGLGRLLADGVFARDYPVVQGCLLFTALLYVIVNLVVDLFYPLFDPRVSAE